MWTSMSSANVRVRSLTSIITTQPHVMAPERSSVEFAIVHQDGSAINASVRVPQKRMILFVDKSIAQTLI